MSNLQDEFVPFIQQLLDNEEMLRWFMSLSSLQMNERTIEIRNRVILMSQTNEDDSVLKMLATLSDSDVFDIIRAVLLAELNKKQLN
ncbi:MAG: hypothetical protein OEX19_10140 [Gammaproteobacteria bacterium]|nr:hypothetical protein [Gammaproteobacteria bacterium]